MTKDKIQNSGLRFDPCEAIPVPYAVFRLLYNTDHSQVVNTQYVYVNQAYCQMAGYDKEDLIGHCFLELYPEGNDWLSYCQEVLEFHKPVHACSFSEETKHWLDFTVGPAGEDLVSFVFTNVDETVRKNEREKTTSHIILRISKILNNGENFEASMNRALKELSQYIHPDRLYVLETDGRTASNTFEWCADGIRPEIDTLQNVDYDGYLGGWEKYLENSTDVVISDIEELKEDDPIDYENLKRQGIHRLAAAPFYHRGRLIGYLGADNYKQDDLVNTQLTLNTISYFIGAKIVNHRLMEDLNRLSHMDTMTNVHNRNAMIEKMNALEKEHIAVGFVYADVNSLKDINDTKGHEAGDEALRYAADMLAFYFSRENVYRAGGDEFVVILPQMNESEFTEKTEALTEKLDQDNPYQFSFGAYWCSDSAETEEALRKADQRMYEEKARFYQKKGMDRRKRNAWNR